MSSDFIVFIILCVGLPFLVFSKAAVAHFTARKRAQSAMEIAADILDPHFTEHQSSRAHETMGMADGVLFDMDPIAGLPPFRRGSTRGFDFEIFLTQRTPKNTMLTVELGQTLNFTIGRESFGTRMSKVLTGEDVLIGDREFDAAVCIMGNEGAVLPYMDYTTRDAVKAAVLHNASLSLSSIRINMGRSEDDPMKIISSFELMLTLAESLNKPSGSTTARIADIARTDPQAAVRMRYYRYLLEHSSKLPIIHELTRALFEDEDVSIRMVAAATAQADGVPVLLAIAQDTNQVMEVRCEAFRTALPHAEESPQCIDLIDEWIMEGEETQVCLALEAAAQLKLSLMPNLFDAVMARGKWAEMKALVSVFEYGPRQLTAPVLLDYVRVADDALLTDMLPKIIELGGAPLIPHLEERASSGSSSLRRAVRSAVVEIQNRIAPELRGAMTMATDHNEGALSRVPDSAEESNL